MDLYASTTSPFVRKVLIVAIESGIENKLNIIYHTLTPISPNDQVVARNPLGKIPALALSDGVVLYDSRVICEYLDSLHDGHKLFPPESPLRWRALRLQALADGVLDASISVRYEATLRPEPKRWEPWEQAQLGKVARGLTAFEEAVTIDQLNTLDIGSIAMGCALGYLDFRFADSLDWRKTHPKLTPWYDALSGRPAMRQTEPHG